MYRIGSCACGTACTCPECAHHRQQPHSHQPQQGQPVQGHGGEPCPVRCANCYDCAGGLTHLLDPSAYRVPAYDVDALSAFSGSDPNGSVQSFESEAQTGAYTPNGQFSATGPGFFSPDMVDASGMDVDIDNAEFNAAMAGLDAGIGASDNHPNNNITPDASSLWDRPRCGFAVSGERGNGSPGHARIGSEVGSEIGVGSDGGYELGSELGIGSDDGCSIAGTGVGSTNLSLDFADMDFGGLALPPMQQYPYPDHVSQRFSGEYSHSMHGAPSSQFSNHSNLSLVSSLDSASLASPGSSHRIASLASSHGIPPSGRITPGHSGRITPIRGMSPHSPQAGKPLPRGYRRILPKVAATVTSHRPFRRLHSHSQQPSLHAVMESDVGGGNVTSPPPSQVLLQPQAQVQQPRVRRSVRSHLPIVGKYFAPGGRYEPSRFRNLNQAQPQQGGGMQGGHGFRGQGQIGLQAQVQQTQVGHGPGTFQGQQAQQAQNSVSAYQASNLAMHDSGMQAQSVSASVMHGQPSSSALQDQGQTSSQMFQGQPYPSFSQAQAPFTHSGSAFDHSPLQEQIIYVEADDGVIYEEQEPEPEMDQYEYGAVYQDNNGMAQYDAGASPGYDQLSVSLPAHAQMVAALSHGHAPALTPSMVQASQSYSHLPQEQPQSTTPRPQLTAQQHSSHSTAMPPPIVIDSAVHSPQPLPPSDPTPSSPRQKVSSGVPMPLTMSLPTTGARTLGSMMVGRHAYDDADADTKVPIKELSPGVGGGGRKSRWPSFSVHGHRVTVGAKVMGSAYVSRS